jgi:hypothetical protein
MITVSITPDRLAGNFVRLVCHSRQAHYREAIIETIKKYYGKDATYSEIDLMMIPSYDHRLVCYLSKGDITEHNQNGAVGMLARFVTVEARRW